MFDDIVKYLPKPDWIKKPKNGVQFRIDDVPDKARNYIEDGIIVINAKFCKKYESALFLILHETFHNFYNGSIEGEKACDLGAILVMKKMCIPDKVILQSINEVLGNEDRKMAASENVLKFKTL